jgi:uncharacterized protein
MKEHILEVLKQIEVEYEVKILYACESGSRAWGYSSKDSDFDVRFIYVQKKEWYLAIDQLRDVIEIPKHDKISIPVDQRLDLSGWELTKALKLFRKSNPPLLEWLHSSIVYYQASSTIDKMKELEGNVFSPISCLFHYLSIAKGNYRERQKVNIKKYINMIRPILAAKWIERSQTIPPVEIQFLVDALLPAGELKDSIHALLKRKMDGEDHDHEIRIEIISQFVKEEMERLDAYAKGLKIDIPNPTEKLNHLFRETLEEVWN